MEIILKRKNIGKGKGASNFINDPIGWQNLRTSLRLSRTDS
jgi:hypothetical protein